MSCHPHEPADILLIEEDLADALMVRESFAQAGKDSRFHVVPNASQAMRFLRQAEELRGAPQPELVQLDLALPDVHGLQVLAEIKAGADLTMVPVVVLSISRRLDDVRRSCAMPASAYIIKPSDFDRPTQSFTVMPVRGFVDPPRDPSPRSGVRIMPQPQTCGEHVRHPLISPPGPVRVSWRSLGGLGRGVYADDQVSREAWSA